MDELLASMKATATTPGAEDLKNMLSGQHSWHSVFNARPTFCNICKESVNRNVISHGVTCEVCKLKVHKRCVEKTINNCKWTTLASVGKDIIEDDQGTVIMPHQWLEGNIPLYTKCAVCAKNCGSMRRLQDWKCIWCRTCVHTACRPKYSIMCSLGPNHVSVLPPTAIQSIGIDDAWDAIRPQGCLPLLVFVNSKSGDNQGVKFHRRFRQLLNPAQVFDLISCGPTLGLRLFRHFHPFRVLVCSGDGSVGWVLSEVDRLNMQLQCQVGVLPLGTGNDLARVLGWGAACDDDTHLPQLLEKYERATTKVLDRWSIMVFERSIKVGDVAKLTLNTKAMSETELKTTAAAYEDSVLCHLSKIIESNQPTIMMSSAKVLCEIIRDFLEKISHVTLTQGDDDFSGKCSLIKTKLDHLLDLLNASILDAKKMQANEKVSIDTQEKTSCDGSERFAQLHKKALIERANSLKKAVRRVVEHAEKVLDEHFVTPSFPHSSATKTANMGSPKKQCLSPSSPRFTLNVISISPLPEVRRDSSSSNDMNLESLPVPKEFADSRHGSFAETCDESKIDIELDKYESLYDEDHVSETYVESETSNSYLLKGLFDESEDDETDPKSESTKQVIYMIPSRKRFINLEGIVEKEGSAASLCEELAHIGHIDSSETDESPDNSSNLTKNGLTLQKATGNIAIRNDSNLDFSIEGVCHFGSELEMTNLLRASTEEKCSEEYKKSMGLDMNKRCSIAHFIEGSDIARQSIKCRHRNRSFNDIDRDCIAVFPASDNHQEHQHADTLPRKNSRKFPKLESELNVPRIQVSSDDNCILHSDQQSTCNIDNLFATHKDPNFFRYSCAVSETDDDEFFQYGDLRKSDALANSSSTGPTVIIDPPSPASNSPCISRKVTEPSPICSPLLSSFEDFKRTNKHCRRLSAASPLMSVHCSPNSARRVSNISLLTSETSELKDSSSYINERPTIYQRLPIINPLVRLPQWPNVKETGIVGKALLANADALCAAAAPIMDQDEAIIEGFFERCVMNNYFGIGIDAKISLDFHQKREEHPEKCRSRTRNYMWYGVLGSKQWLQKTCKNLEQRVQLECDGQRIPLPSLQGIVVLNIPSFMGGINFWGGTKGDDIFLSPSIDDRVLEVVAVFGTVQMAASRLMNLQHHRIAQCSNVLIHILGEEGVPIQVDGEAWVQPPGLIRIIHKNKVKMLCRNEKFDCTPKEWEEKQRQLRQQGRLNSSAKPTELTDDEIGSLLSFIEATTSLIKYVKLLTIRSPSIETDMYQLAEAVASNLERVHPSGKLLQGVELRLAVTDLVINAQRLVEEAIIVLQDKNVRLIPEIEGPLNSSIQHMEIELKKCCFTGANQTSLVYFKLPSPDKEYKTTGRRSSAGAFWQRFRRNSGISTVRYTRREVATWDVSDVTHWLETIQLSEYAESFSSNDVRGRELLTLTRTDLKELGVSKVGHVKRLLLAIKEFLP